MADPFRIVRLCCWLCLGLFLGGVTSLVHAETMPAISQDFEIAPVDVWWLSNKVGPNPQTVCQLQLGGSYGSTVRGSASIYSCLNTSGEPQASAQKSCPATYSASYGANEDVSLCYKAGLSYSCPSGLGWTLAGATCTRPDCLSPQVRDASTGLCVAPACPSAGSAPPTKYYSGITGTMPNSLCINSCGYNTGGFGMTFNGGWVMEAGKSTGVSCTANAATNLPPLPDPKTACVQSGQAFGTVNGQVVCVPPTSLSTTQTGTNTPAVGGASTTNVTNNTSCTVEGSCSTTTTTTTTSGGSGPGGTGPGSTTTTDTKTEDQPRATFCEENPNSPMCKESSFGGACSAGAVPVCLGDAVQCAQAAAAWKIQCDLSTEPTGAAYELGKTLANGGADPAGDPFSAANTQTIDVAGIVANAGNHRTLTAQCVPAPTFTVAGVSYTMPVAQFCSFAEIVGYLMVAVSAVIAIRMIVGGA